MAGPFWEPLPPFLPLQHRASLSCTLSQSILPRAASRPHPAFFPVLSAQAPYIPTFPLPLLEGGSPRLAGLKCMDLVPSPGKCPRSCSQAPSPGSWEGEGKARRGLGGTGILDRFSRLLQLCWRSGHSRRDQSAYPVAAVRVHGAERPGRPSCASHSLSLLPFSRFSGCGERTHACLPRFGEGWGGAEGLGRRQGCFYEKEITVLPRRPHRALQSSALREVFALFYSLPLSLLCPHLHLTRVWPVHSSLGGPRPPEVARAPSGPIRLVQNDNDTHQRASLSGIACAQPPQPGLRRMRVLRSVAEPVRQQRKPPGERR